MEGSNQSVDVTFEIIVEKKLKILNVLLNGRNEVRKPSSLKGRKMVEWDDRAHRGPLYTPVNSLTVTKQNWKSLHSPTEKVSASESEERRFKSRCGRKFQFPGRRTQSWFTNEKDPATSVWPDSAKQSRLELKRHQFRAKHKFDTVRR